MNLQLLPLAVLALGVVFSDARPAIAAEKEPGLSAQVDRIIADMGDLSPAVRERAELRLRNLPLDAYPLVTAIYERDKEKLEVEPRARIESSITMFKALAALDARQQKHWDWIKKNSLAAYDQAGSHNPTWDAAVREAIAAATSWPRGGMLAQKMEAAAATANDAKCDDPLFLYQYALFYSTKPDADERRAMDLMQTAATKITSPKCGYPAWLKCLVHRDSKRH